MFKEKRIVKTHLPVIDITKCINCDLCYIVCPKSVIHKVTSNACAKCIKYCISMKVPCDPQNYVIDYKQCDACGLCVSVCKSQAVYWYKVVN
jgi:Pyruvate/2-oxoacid:ferredoxin oxidoreductase delta subunit